MSFNGLLITEIFHSIQGETSAAGKRFAFIRLTGCNLRCSYCDSAYAFKGGKRMSVEEVLKEIAPYQVKEVLLTGGEPLLQRNSLAMIQALRARGYSVSIETHGEISIEAVAPFARIVMDIKTPSSGMNRGYFWENLRWLKPGDEIKFVITSREDYAWSKEIISRGKLPSECEILLSPVVRAVNSPGDVASFSAQWLAESILADRLNVRMQLQLHKIIWGSERTGV